MAVLSQLASLLISKKQDYRSVFSGRDGECVLDDLLRECQLERDPTVPMDPLSTGVNIGRQLVGKFIQNRLHMPDEEIIRRANLNTETEDGIEEGSGADAHV